MNTPLQLDLFDPVASDWRKYEHAALRYLESCGIKTWICSGNPTIQLVRFYEPVGDDAISEHGIADFAITDFAKYLADEVGRGWCARRYDRGYRSHGRQSVWREFTT